MAVNNVIRMLNLTRGLNTDGDVDADSLADNFVSNTYIGGTYVSNNFFQDNAGGLAAVGANTFTSGSGNYTVPAGVNFLSGFVVGGGGGGGGNRQGNSGFTGGGGGSSPAAHFTTSVTPGDTIAYSVGTGGNSSTNSSTNSFPSGGGSGNASNFGTYATSNGGAGGGSSPGAAGNATGNALTFVSAGQQPQKSVSASPGGVPPQQVIGFTSTFKKDGTPISFGSVPAGAGGGGEGSLAHFNGTFSEPGHAGAIVVVEFT